MERRNLQLRPRNERASRRSAVLTAVALVGFIAPFATSARAQAATTETGVAADAQPGLYRVGAAEPAKPAIAATAGYGFTEAQNDDDGTHHRLSLRLAAAAALLPWLNVGPILDGRYDLHPDDSGAVFDAALAVRSVVRAGKARLGLELKPWVAGSEEASSTFKALSLDSRLLAGVEFGAARIFASGGYRLDRSAEAGENAADLGFGDRLALGLSDFDAALVGLGVGVTIGHTELLGEGSGDILIGSGAPPLSESPLRVTGGVRQELSRGLFAELIVDVALSSRPELGADAPLVPVEPRVSAVAGIRYRFGAERAVDPSHEPEATPAPIVTPVAQKATDAPLEVVVLDEQGAPVDGAELTVTTKGVPRELGRHAEGRYRAEHVPAGSGELSVEAAGFEPFKKSVTLEAGTPQRVDVTLTALPPPSQIRGMVRSFGGQGLSARVRVAPLGVETTTDASGAFQIDVPPGAYEVTVEADGYEIQKRQVRVEAQGVVILNADLVKKGGKK